MGPAMPGTTQECTGQKPPFQITYSEEDRVIAFILRGVVRWVCHHRSGDTVALVEHLSTSHYYGALLTGRSLAKVALGKEVSQAEELRSGMVVTIRGEMKIDSGPHIKRKKVSLKAKALRVGAAEQGVAIP